MLNTINCTLLLFILSFFFSCSSNKKNIQKTNNEIHLNNELSEILDSKFNDITKKNIQTDSLVILLNEKNIEYSSLMNLLNDKIELLDEKILSIDSIHKQVSLSLQLIEDNINLLSKSYNEISQLEASDDIKDVVPISEQEFKTLYIESLALYQNGEWSKSLEGFKYLLSVGSNTNLLDNCQYWIGEIHFKLKEFHIAINEFEKVFQYLESNKRDDALYKLSKCYSILGNDLQSNAILKKLIEDFPNSEYVKKAKNLINR